MFVVVVVAVAVVVAVDPLSLSFEHVLITIPVTIAALLTLWQGHFLCDSCRFGGNVRKKVLVADGTCWTLAFSTWLPRVNCHSDRTCQECDWSANSSILAVVYHRGLNNYQYYFGASFFLSIA